MRLDLKMMKKHGREWIILCSILESMWRLTCNYGKRLMIYYYSSFALLWRQRPCEVDYSIETQFRTRHSKKKTPIGKCQNGTFSRDLVSLNKSNLECRMHCTHQLTSRGKSCRRILGKACVSENNMWKWFIRWIRWRWNCIKIELISTWDFRMCQEKFELRNLLLRQGRTD